MADSVTIHAYGRVPDSVRKGRGLGLVIVQEIRTDHGFGYSLENRAGGGAESDRLWPS